VVAHAPELTGTLKKIKDRKKVKLGYRRVDPFAYLQQARRPEIGYSIDLATPWSTNERKPRKSSRLDIAVKYKKK